MKCDEFYDILDKWKAKPEEDLKKVLKVLDHLENNYGLEYWKSKKGSHYVMKHKLFKNDELLMYFKLNPKERMNGEFSISTKKGKKVVNKYIRRIKLVAHLLEFAKKEELL